MKTVYHPTLDVSYEVDDKAVDEWAESGWLKRAPKSSVAATAADQSGDDTEGK